jgi:hypothetical protein
MPTALQLAKQQEQEQKERGDETELQTTPNKEGQAKRTIVGAKSEKQFPRGLTTHTTRPKLNSNSKTSLRRRLKMRFLIRIQRVHAARKLSKAQSSPGRVAMTRGCDILSN